MSYTSLTKIVTLTPRYVVHNKSQVLYIHSTSLYTWLSHADFWYAVHITMFITSTKYFICVEANRGYAISLYSLVTMWFICLLHQCSVCLSGQLKQNRCSSNFSDLTSYHGHLISMRPLRFFFSFTSLWPNRSNFSAFAVGYCCDLFCCFRSPPLVSIYKKKVLEEL